MKRPEEEEVLEEAEEIVPDPVPVLGQDPAPEDEDLDPDLIQEVALNLGRAQEIVLNRNQDRPKMQHEIDLDPGLHLDLRMPIERRMEIDLHLGRRMHHGLDLALALVHDPDPEANKSGNHSSWIIPIEYHHLLLNEMLFSIISLGSSIFSKFQTHLIVKNKSVCMHKNYMFLMYKDFWIADVMNGNVRRVTEYGYY